MNFGFLDLPSSEMTTAVKLRVRQSSTIRGNKNEPDIV
jgi:hypothetical protein